MSTREKARQFVEIGDGGGEDVGGAGKRMISRQRTGNQTAWAETLPDGWSLHRLKAVAIIRYGLGQPPPEFSPGVVKHDGECDENGS